MENKISPGDAPGCTFVNSNSDPLLPLKASPSNKSNPHPRLIRRIIILAFTKSLVYIYIVSHISGNTSDGKIYIKLNLH